MAFGTRARTRFAILPPTRTAVPGVFRSVAPDNRRRQSLLASMQRLRGKVYGADGAVRTTDLTRDGRHVLSVDENSWHVLSVDASGEVTACLRYLEESHISSFDNLWVRHAALSRCPSNGTRFRRAVESEMQRARRSSMQFGEVGGWAVCVDHRGTAEALRIVLATYALLELLGSCAGVATATFRHSSAEMLQRIGLATLRADDAEIPPYFDPQYGCMMQVLRFDSRQPNPKYLEMIQDLGSELIETPVICRENIATVLGRVWRGMETPELMPATSSGM